MRMELLENELNPERFRMWVLQSTKNLIVLFHCPLYIVHYFTIAIPAHFFYTNLIDQIWVCVLAGNEFTHHAKLSPLDHQENWPTISPSANQPTKCECLVLCGTKMSSCCQVRVLMRKTSARRFDLPLQSTKS